MRIIYIDCLLFCWSILLHFYRFISFCLNNNLYTILVLYFLSFSLHLTLLNYKGRLKISVNEWISHKQCELKTSPAHALVDINSETAGSKKLKTVCYEQFENLRNIKMVQRINSKFCYKLGAALETHAMLVYVYGIDKVSKKCVYDCTEMESGIYCMSTPARILRSVHVIF